MLTPPIPKRVVIADATEAARGLDEWGSAEATTLSALYSEHLATIEGVKP
ncbi:ParA family protein [Glutamicibacter creatinolyticus]|uniref:ParA family protein n=1 Tax=Glutamicibacter creatinolyticus TaxID=162496 RepID=A0A5B7WV24_9MICC|nr:ParA family protein [Glutamicibacter creatinolyticus]